MKTPLLGNRGLTVAASVLAGLLLAAATTTWASEPVPPAQPAPGQPMPVMPPQLPVPQPSAAPGSNTFPSPISGPIFDDSMDPDKKGTIGMICVDMDGQKYRPSRDVRGNAEFERCLRVVVSKWYEERVSGDKHIDPATVDYNQWVDGFTSFRDLTDRVRHQ